MSLSKELGELLETGKMKVLTFDIETTRAVVETFSLFTNYIHIDRVKMPSRILCFSARWLGEDKTIFHSAWDDADVDSQVKLVRKLFNLLSEADVVVTWNGNRFDCQWVEEECGRLGIGKPTPYKSVDLCAVAKKNFKGGLMSMKLDWSARTWLRDSKVKHGGSDLWDDIRYGTREEKRAARKLMKEYCIYDTVLTERLIERYLPWIPINIALYRSDPSDETLRCTRCGSNDLHIESKKHVTSAFAYTMYRCQVCGSVSRGKRSKIGAELRPVV